MKSQTSRGKRKALILGNAAKYREVMLTEAQLTLALIDSKIAMLRHRRKQAMAKLAYWKKEDR